MFNIGTPELLVILLIALIIVGPSRLPELSRSIGKGLREFRKVQDEVKDMVKLDLEEPATRKPATPTAPGVHRTPRPVASQRPGSLDGPAEPAKDGANAGTDEATEEVPRPGAQDQAAQETRREPAQDARQEQEPASPAPDQRADG